MPAATTRLARCSRYEAVAGRSGRPRPRAALRCRAPLWAAGSRFEAALAEHERWGNPFERARTQLLYGEFLRARSDAVMRASNSGGTATFDDTGAASGRSGRGPGLGRRASERAGVTRPRSTTSRLRNERRTTRQ